jgi:hypothetical protein
VTPFAGGAMAGRIVARCSSGSADDVAPRLPGRWQRHPVGLLRNQICQQLTRPRLVPSPPRIIGADTEVSNHGDSEVQPCRPVTSGPGRGQGTLSLRVGGSLYVVGRDTRRRDALDEQRSMSRLGHGSRAKKRSRYH